jgi:hypothetical protein
MTKAELEKKIAEMTERAAVLAEENKQLKSRTATKEATADEVYWVKDGIPIKSRIDVVTKITTNSRGDKVYLTEEVNGNRKGMAYEDHIYLAAIVDSIPFFDEYQEA